jgi:quercetin dioxygenase-like cupin family protein
VTFTAFGKMQNLEAGKLLYLPMGEPHTVKGIENASLLLTIPPAQALSRCHQRHPVYADDVC